MPKQTNTEKNIDELMEKFKSLRSSAAALSLELEGVVNKIANESLVPSSQLIQAKQCLERHCEIQDEFCLHMGDLLSNDQSESYSRIDGIFAEKKSKSGLFEKTLDALNKFQMLSIDHAETKLLLDLCKEKALAISKVSDVDEILMSAEPYKLFLELMDKSPEDITAAQEQAINNNFVSPIPRMLWAKRFYITTQTDIAIADNDETNPNKGESEASDFVSKVVSPESNERFSFETKKSGKLFGVKSFKQDLQSVERASALHLLYNFAWYGLISEEQVLEYLQDENKNIGATLSFLTREGYVTEITDNKSVAKFFCLSQRGVQIFLHKDSWNEFIRTGNGKSFERNKPSSFMAAENLRGNEKLTNDLIQLNKVALPLYEDKLLKFNFVSSITIYIKEIISQHIPYAEYILHKGDNDLKVLLLCYTGLTELNESSLIELVKSENDLLLIVRNESDNKATVPHIVSEVETLFIRYAKNGISVFDSDGNEQSVEQLIQKKANCLENVQVNENLLTQKDIEQVPKNTDAKKETPVISVEESQEGEFQSFDGMNQKIVFSSSDSSEASKNYEIKDKLSVVVNLLSEGKFVDSIVLAKSLSFLPRREYLTFYKRLLFASNMSLDVHKYSSQIIGELDESEVSLVGLLPDDLLKLLRLSTFAWGLLLPSISHDYPLYNYRDGVIAESENELRQFVPSLKSVFEILFELGDISPVGFSNTVVSAFINDKENQLANQRLKSQATSLLSYTIPNMRTHLAGVPEIFRGCFDKSNELGRCMRIVADDDALERIFVQTIFSKFCEEADESVSISADKIENYIDSAWDSVEVKKNDIRKKPEKLMHEVRKTVFANVNRRLEIISDWLALNNTANAAAIKNNQRLASLRNRLINKLGEVNLELENALSDNSKELSAGFNVLKFSFAHIKCYLQDCTSFHNKWDYIELLRSHFVSLDSNYMPALNPALQSVYGFEPWRRVMAHIESVKIPFERALESIDDPANHREWFKNYAAAVIINQYLHETEDHVIDDYDKAIEQAQKHSIVLSDDFRGELELAYAYGQIEESAKEGILTAINAFSDYFTNIGDFAQHESFINVLRDQIATCANKRKNDLVSKMNSLDNLLNDPDNKMLPAINKTINEHNLTVAEEYINRLEQGDDSLVDELTGDLEVDADTDYHEQFVSDYSFFNKLCAGNTNENVLVRWGERGIELKIKKFSPGQRNNSRRLLESWPRGMDSNTLKSDVVKLLENFGFAPEAYTLKEVAHKKCKVFDIKVKARSKHLEDYSHPIARFGTQISEPMSIMCLFGRTFSSPNALKEIFIDGTLKLEASTLVLVDASFSLNERRQMAEILKSEIHSVNSFIVIDRTLMLFLATLDSGKWLSALLKCALPYTYCQPYSYNGGVTADEMFFGRKAELHNIRDYNGACFVYGGRQLGKTALLKRACSLMHNPSQKKFAFYVDVKNCDSKHTAIKISEEFEYQQFTIGSFDSIQKLCSAISAKFNSKEAVELQLYVDEADDFLEDVSNEDFEELKFFKDLQDRYPNKFKVVFAGLHKVVHHKNNSVMGHLRKPLPILPLSTSDAKNLIERPLSHLGFKFQDMKQLSLVMASTNYYPGLLHMFCYALIESISADYKAYYSATRGNPPFVISEEHLRRIIFTAKLNDGIKDFFNKTLSLDYRYKLIANIIAYLCYRDKHIDEISLDGFELDEIKSCEDIPLTKEMKRADFEIFLLEMVEMGILWNKKDSNLYRLRRTSFLEMLGTEDEVGDFIISAMCGEYE